VISKNEDVPTAAGPGGGRVVRTFDCRTLARLNDIPAYDPGFIRGVFVGGR
jgi:hypothetical protein